MKQNQAMGNNQRKVSNKELAQIYYATHISYSNAGELLIREYNHLMTNSVDDGEHAWYWELIRPALHNRYISLELGLKGIIVLQNQAIPKTHCLKILLSKIPELSNFKDNDVFKKINDIIKRTRYLFENHEDPNEVDLYFEGDHMGNRYVLLNFYESPMNRSVIDALSNEIDKIYSKHGIEL